MFSSNAIHCAQSLPQGPIRDLQFSKDYTLLLPVEKKLDHEHFVTLSCQHHQMDALLPFLQHLNKPVLKKHPQ